MRMMLPSIRNIAPSIWKILPSIRKISPSISRIIPPIKKIGTTIKIILPSKLLRRLFNILKKPDMKKVLRQGLTGGRT